MPEGLIGRFLQILLSLAVLGGRSEVIGSIVATRGSRVYAKFLAKCANLRDNERVTTPTED